jgi:hypothetical protein
MSAAKSWIMGELHVELPSATPVAPQVAPQPTPTPKPRAITYTKLKDGSWGILAGQELSLGALVTVVKRSGETKNEILGELVYAGEGDWVYRIGHNSSRPVRRARAWRPCGYPGCNPSHCDECEGEGYRSGR